MLETLVENHKAVGGGWWLAWSLAVAWWTPRIAGGWWVGPWTLRYFLFALACLFGTVLSDLINSTETHGYVLLVALVSFPVGMTGLWKDVRDGPLRQVG